MQSCAFREEIQRMANHLFITVQGILYSRPFCVVLFIISQERYHKATLVHSFSSAYIPTRYKSNEIWSPHRQCSFLTAKIHSSQKEIGNNLADHVVLKEELKLTT